MPPLAPLTLALYEPDIAPNAGAMLRTCACFAAEAAIIEPAGFVLTDSGLRRAGMDYLDALSLRRHASFARFRAMARRRRPSAGAADDERRDGAVGFRLPARRRHPGRPRIGGRPRFGSRRGRRAHPHPDRAAAALAQRRRRRGAGARRGAPPARWAVAGRLEVTKRPSCAMIPTSEKGRILKMRREAD